MAEPFETHAKARFEAELSVPSAAIRIVRFHLDQPTDRIFRREDRYWLDMCLTPRPEQVRGDYRERWGPHRYERLGEIFLMPPGEALHLRSEVGDDQLSIVCELEADAVERWLEHGIEWTDRRLAACLDIAHPHIRSCLFRLAEEARHPRPDSLAIAELVARQLAIEVARFCEAIAEGPISGGLASWRLRLIDERLQRPGPPPALAELAALCSMSVRQLTRGFRTSRGGPIGDHIAMARIEKGKRLLAGSDNIKGIAAALGFANPSAFSYAFRRATGSTPRQFRQRQLQRGLGHRSV